MNKFCPKCDDDITDSYQPDDWSVGIVGGYYCERCDIAINEDETDTEIIDTDVSIMPPSTSIPGTPISQLSGRPGHPGYEEFKRIAQSWGYD